MEYRRLGRSGVRVSEIGLGSWLTLGGYVERSEALACLRAALNAGINFFDTADVYSQGEAERVLGEFLADVPRKDVFVASKCFFPTGDGPNDRGLSRKHVVESLHASLGRLGLDYLDLFQCHRHDPDTPLEEVVGTMSDLVRQGKILYWGVSMWSAAQITRACAVARMANGVAPVSNQPAYSLLERNIEAEVIPVSVEEGLGQVVFSPLAQGVLTGKYGEGDIPKGTRASRKGPAGQFIRRFLEPERLAAVERLKPIAADVGLTMPQLALAWCLRLSAVSSAIVGASSQKQLEENVGASGVSLSVGLREAIEEALRGEEE
ncbi:MAG: aldo/keto reductase family protein [Planctomycetota bacterium]|jgi:voltage-dependent potassium channel beta subunit